MVTSSVKSVVMCSFQSVSMFLHIIENFACRIIVVQHPEKCDYRLIEFADEFRQFVQEGVAEFPVTAG